MVHRHYGIVSIAVTQAKPYLMLTYCIGMGVNASGKFERISSSVEMYTWEICVDR